jgi:hypothetical protein
MTNANESVSNLPLGSAVLDSNREPVLDAQGHRYVWAACYDCQGVGWPRTAVSESRRCATCSGTGRVAQPVRLDGTGTPQVDITDHDVEAADLAEAEAALVVGCRRHRRGGHPRG